MKTTGPGPNFGREVRRRREAHGWTLDDLAARSQLTTNYIGSVEIGHRDPSLSTILALARGLGISPNELFATVPGLDTMAQEAALLYDQVPPAVQAAVMALLRAVRRKPRE